MTQYGRFRDASATADAPPPAASVDASHLVSRRKRQLDALWWARGATSAPAAVDGIAATARAINSINVSNPLLPDNYAYKGELNITGTSFLLTGLYHFTDYDFYISACQAKNETPNYCSLPAKKSVKTASIEQRDEVPLETVAVNVTESRPADRHIVWSAPPEPNGIVVGYYVDLEREGVNTPHHMCINLTDFEKNSGITFTGLADGVHSLKITTVSLAGAITSVSLPNVFTLNNAILTTKLIIIIVLSVVAALLAIIAIAVYVQRRNYNKKFEEYQFQQMVTANPEYLSQMDVYQKDEWELSRDDVTLLEEIGRGTFGTVYRGAARDVKSVCGVVFGECAVKTVPAKSSNSERLHFLVEASVMKQFNTTFIVKLYGVVSEDHVLVVMEMMAKGNLRDFLRAHRPDADEAAGHSYELPTPTQYTTWAAQIADGMGYLESLKFCHRDLAARNCMVHEDETVKIGDFGMARDLYYSEYYQPKGRRLMPIRWMSPESLHLGKFTMKSDVWSYGIIIYEMLTLGQQPYAGLGNDQVLNYIGVQRRTMQRPLDCPDFW